jgi:hypothetical protein
MERITFFLDQSTENWGVEGFEKFAVGGAKMVNDE